MKYIVHSFVAILLICVSGCKDINDVGILNAPVNFTMSEMGSAYTYSFTFYFNAVEKADNYMIYYSLHNDTSTAQPLKAGVESPISYSYQRSNPYGNVTYYFWVRAYNGNTYGNWSTPLTHIMY